MASPGAFALSLMECATNETFSLLLQPVDEIAECLSMALRRQETTPELQKATVAVVKGRSESVS